MHDGFLVRLAFRGLPLKTLFCCVFIFKFSSVSSMKDLGNNKIINNKAASLKEVAI